jgi:serine/threonine protein kinase/Tol biopolymer transport system component
MALSSGTRLGPYEILGPLGAGGMGEVYRARDTRLDRTVAIKVLSAEFSADADRRARLSREARAISSLSHPNICTLYDVGHQDGVDYLVMEHLEGETLADRLEKGPLPTEQVLSIGVEIAGALQGAHRRGLVHRDLKPGNVMLTKSGAKLLDFGLAKAGAAPPVNLTDMPTASKPLTAEGKVVGTFQYMSPEQVEGKEVDARSDIFSFGAVLYEMATGRRAFEGKTQASVAAAILERDPPPVSTRMPLSPPSFDRVVKLCLEKDPDTRWQSAQDIRVQLAWLSEGADKGAAAAATAAPSRARERAAWTIATVCLLVAAVLAAILWRTAPTRAPLIRSSLLPTSGSSFVPYNFALSPDGTRLVYVAAGSDGKSTLWVRVLSAAAAQEINGTETAIYPFWAPDSRRVGFFAEGKLKTVDTAGGGIKVLCEAPVGRGGAWNRDGTIIFSPTVASPIIRISDTGGEPVAVTSGRSEGSGQGHRWPFFLPDGKRFLYFSDWNGPKGPEGNGIYIGSVDGSPAKLLFSDVTGNVEYSEGRLLYVRDRSLLAQPFDPDKLETTGPAIPIAEQEVIQDLGFHHAGFSASQNGMVVIQSTSAFSTRLLWFDASGNQVGQVAGSGYWSPRLSPDGRLLAVAADDAKNGKFYIHVIDLARGASTRLTDAGREETPVWSRDGKRIAFTSVEGNSVTIYETRADGSGPPRKLVSGSLKMINDWSPDDRLVYMDFAKGIPFLGVYSESDGKVTEFAVGAEARISPDGKWIARVEPRTRYQEIFIQPFPEGGARLQISQGGGSQVSWRHDGKELYYMGSDRKLMAATFDPVTRTAGAPRVLFQTHVVGPTFVLFQYDVAPDGRFLINSLNPDSPLTLIANWPAMLPK